MSKEIIYIDYDEALNIYGKMIDASDGGFEGVRDEGGIRATLDFVQNDLYYPTFADKLTYLMYRFCSGHFFNDGNKRIALTLGTYFLHKNNYYWHACICMRTLESIIYHVAASNIDQDLLLRINREEGLRQQLIPYFISSHPGCKEEDMAELAVITKRLDFHLEQVQDFTPTPMTVATEAWYTGFHPYTLEPVFSAKTQREKLAQRQFFFWYKPEERRNIINELRRIGRKDLIDKLYGK